MEPINIDADLDNADWTKRTWDLIGVDDLPSLRAHLREQNMTPEEFMRLPVYKYNVEKMPWLKGLAGPAQKSRSGVAAVLRKARRE